jgi:hypothetical protein
MFRAFTMPIIRSRVSWNKSQDTVASRLVYLYMLNYDVRNDEPKIAWHVSRYDGWKLEDAPSPLFLNFALDTQLGGFR